MPRREKSRGPAHPDAARVGNSASIDYPYDRHVYTGVPSISGEARLSDIVLGRGVLPAASEARGRSPAAGGHCVAAELRINPSFAPWVRNDFPGYGSLFPGAIVLEMVSGSLVLNADELRRWWAKQLKWPHEEFPVENC